MLTFEAISRVMSCEGRLGLTALRTAKLCLPAGGSRALLSHSWIPAWGRLPVAETAASGSQVGGAALQVRLHLPTTLHCFQEGYTPELS